MKILLADDERMVRLSFISMCEELYPGAHQYMQAKNGREMLELCKTEQPDLAFVDIRMPLMDGLSAMEEVLNFCPGTQFIILSGYSDFSYAQRAIRLGAQDYLLKPPSLEDIRKIFTEAERIRDEQIFTDNRAFFYEVMEQFNAYRIFPDSVPPMEGNFSAFLFCADYNEETAQRQFYKELSRQLHKAVNPLIRQGCHYSLFHLPEGELCLIVQTTGKNRRIFDSLREIASEFGIPVTVFHNHAASLQQLFDKIISVMDLFCLRIFCGYGQFLDEQDILRFQANEILLNYAKNIENLQLAFKERDSLLYQRLLDQKKPDSAGLPFEAQLDWEGVQKYILHYFYLEGTVTGFSSLYKLLSAGKELMYQAPSPANIPPHLTEQVKHYVEDHYMEDIGINTISSVYGITPNYLSKLFHQKEGMRFMDYLTRVRISHAKRLLTSFPLTPVSEVAEQVGYNGSRHFSKVFQKITGQTPSEYRKNKKAEG